MGNTIASIFFPFGAMASSMHKQKETTENVKKQTEAMKAPKVPTQAQAEETAKAKQVAKRRTILATGGAVDAGLGSLGQVGSQNLLKKTLG